MVSRFTYLESISRKAVLECFSEWTRSTVRSGTCPIRESHLTLSWTTVYHLPRINSFLSDFHPSSGAVRRGAAVTFGTRTPGPGGNRDTHTA